MRFLIMTDIEGVSGVTTYPQAENSQLGRDMLMNDLIAVIDGIRQDGAHEIVVYDMHTDGRNVDISQIPADIPVVMGKPILGNCYRGVGGAFDGLFLLGLHSMARVPNALLAHSYLVEYDSIHLNGHLVGEIGIEAALAAEQGIPLVFVSGDDVGCKEAETLIPGVVTATVKYSLGDDQAICLPPAKTRTILKEAAAKAAKDAAIIAPLCISSPYTVEIKYSNCRYLEIMKNLHPEIFIDAHTVQIQGENLLECWSNYLVKEKRMMKYE